MGNSKFVEQVSPTINSRNIVTIVARTMGRDLNAIMSQTVSEGVYDLERQPVGTASQYIEVDTLTSF